MATKKQVREIKALLAELGDKLAEASDDTKEELMEDSQHLMEDLKEQLITKMAAAKAKGRHVYEKARKAGKKADEYAHENPWHVAAGTLAVGALIGFLIANQKK